MAGLDHDSLDEAKGTKWMVGRDRIASELAMDQKFYWVLSLGTV